MRRWAWPLLAVLFTAPAALPLLAPGYLDTHAYGDSPYLLLRLFELDRNIQNGLWYSRWAPDFAYGYGYPFFNYYAPLPYYLAEAFHLAGLDLMGAIKATQSTAMAVAALTMYALASGLWGRRAGFLAAAAYTYVPFHLVNIYLRGDALGEFTAYALMPLVLWLFWRLAHGAGLLVLAGSSAVYTALVLTHNVTAMTFSPLLGGFFLASWLLQARSQPYRWRSLAGGALAIGLGLAASAFFWAPALLEKDYVQMQAVTTGYFDFHNHFLPLGGLLPLDFLYNYGHDARPIEGLPFRVGIVQAIPAILAPAALLTLFIARHTRHRAFSAPAWWGWAALATCLLLVWLVTPLSAGIWEAAPLLKWAQFPWRLLILIALGTALLAGALVWAVEQLTGRRYVMLLILVLAAASVVSGTWTLWPEHIALDGHSLSASRVFEYEYLTTSIGSTVRQEYLPVEVKERPWSSRLVLSYPEVKQPGGWASDGEGVVEPVALRGAYQEYVVSGPATFSFHTYSFPSWEARLDGSPAEVKAQPGTGLLEVQVPPGEHRLALELRDTPLRQTASGVSLVSGFALLSLVVLGWLRLRRSINMPSQARVEPCQSWPEIIAVAVLLAALLLLWPYWKVFGREGETNGADTLAADVHSPLAHYHPAGVDFGDQWRWQGYEISSREIIAGGELSLSIRWQPLKGDQPLTVEARLIHPADYLRQEDRTVSTSKAQLELGNGTSSTTTHQLLVPTGTPPGLYQVEVKPSVPSGPLPMMTSTGHPTDRHLLLGPVVVRRGVSSPMGTGRPALAEWSGQLRLEGTQVLAADTDRVRLALNWRALARLSEPYRVSLRLVDSEGHRWGQQDSQPVDGFYPANLWEPGEEVIDRHDLRPIPGTPPGRYAVECRVYSLATGKEISLSSTSGTAAQIAEVELQPSGGLSRPASISRPIDHAFSPGIRLKGTGPIPGEARPGEKLSLALFWQAAEAPVGDYSVLLEMIGPNGDVWAFRQVPLASSSYPMAAWPSGAVVLSQHSLLVRTEAGAGLARLRVTLVDPAGQKLPNPAMIGEIRVTGRERSFAIPTIGHPRQARLGGGVVLLGYDITDSGFVPGGEIPLTLYWQAEDASEVSYTVFAQLLGPDSKLWGQQDTVPGQGMLPTTGWAKGEVITDTYRIPIKPDAPPGEYRLLVGMYDAATGQRLEVEDGGHPVPERHVVLTSIQLKPRP